MELKELVGEELYKPIADKLNGHTVIIAAKDEKYIKDDGNFIPKARFNEVIEQKNSYKETVDSLKTEMETLKTKAAGNEEVKKQIDDLNTKLGQKDSEVATISKKYALKDALREAGARYPDLLLTKFDLGSIVLENEKIKDFDSLLKPVKELFPDLFGQKQAPQGDGGVNKDKDVITLTDAQKKEAHEKFPALPATEAEELWFRALKQSGKIK